MTAQVHGPFPAGTAAPIEAYFGSTGAGSSVTPSDFTTVHQFRGNVWYTVIKA